MQPYLSVFVSAKFKAFFALLCPSGLFLEMRLDSKKFLDLLCRQSTLVCEVKPYIFLGFFATFWPLRGYFLPLGPIFGVGVRFKTLFEPTYEYDQLRYSKYSPIFLCFNSVKI